jgi:hypothetical protein
MKEDISFVVIRNKLKPTFKNGYVFNTSQILTVFGDENSATTRAKLESNKTGKNTAIWKYNYNIELEFTTLLELIKIINPD